MPKLLPNLRDDLLREAAELLQQEGYTGLSMRALAARCHVATGTVYNYFSSKDELIAQIMMADWMTAIQAMSEIAHNVTQLPEGLEQLCGALRHFIVRYSPVWQQYTDQGGSGSVVGAHHGMLRGQIADMVRQLISRTADEDLLHLSDLLAETVLASALHPDLDPQALRLLGERLMDQTR